MTERNVHISITMQESNEPPVANPLEHKQYLEESWTKYWKVSDEQLAQLPEEWIRLLVALAPSKIKTFKDNGSGNGKNMTGKKGVNRKSPPLRPCVQSLVDTMVNASSRDEVTDENRFGNIHNHNMRFGQQLTHVAATAMDQVGKNNYEKIESSGLKGEWDEFMLRVDAMAGEHFSSDNTSPLRWDSRTKVFAKVFRSIAKVVENTL